MSSESRATAPYTSPVNPPSFFVACQPKYTVNANAASPAIIAVKNISADTIINGAINNIASTVEKIIVRPSVRSANALPIPDSRAYGNNPIANTIISRPTSGIT